MDTPPGRAEQLRFHANLRAVLPKTSLDEMEKRIPPGFLPRTMNPNDEEAISEACAREYIPCYAVGWPITFTFAGTVWRSRCLGAAIPGSFPEPEGQPARVGPNLTVARFPIWSPDGRQQCSPSATEPPDDRLYWTVMVVAVASWARGLKFRM